MVEENYDVDFEVQSRWSTGEGSAVKLRVIDALQLSYTLTDQGRSHFRCP